MKKAQYRTRQMGELVTYMKSRKGEHVTAGELSCALKEMGISVGTTTVYRHLERMVKEGSVAKYTVDGSSSACFEYLGDKNVCHRPLCFHCKCEECGKLIHMHCPELEEIDEHLKKEHGFLVNPLRTVFYGLCEECQRKGETLV